MASKNGLKGSLLIIASIALLIVGMGAQQAAAQVFTSTVQDVELRCTANQEIGVSGYLYESAGTATASEVQKIPGSEFQLQCDPGDSATESFNQAFTNVAGALVTYGLTGPNDDGNVCYLGPEEDNGSAAPDHGHAGFLPGQPFELFSNPAGNIDVATAVATAGDPAADVTCNINDIGGIAGAFSAGELVFGGPDSPQQQLLPNPATVNLNNGAIAQVNLDVRNNPSGGTGGLSVGAQQLSDLRRIGIVSIEVLSGNDQSADPGHLTNVMGSGTGPGLPTGGTVTGSLVTPDELEVALYYDSDTDGTCEFNGDDDNVSVFDPEDGPYCMAVRSSTNNGAGDISYLITVQYTDEDGATDTFEVRVNVNRTNPGGVGGLSVSSIQTNSTMLTGNSALNLSVSGTGVASTQIDVFDLTGRHVAQESTSGNTLRFRAMSENGLPLANGVYLYTVTVQGHDGKTIRSDVRKFVVMR